MKMALGRGLDALIPDKGEEVINIDIDKIIPLESQPRKVFKDETIQELSISIKETGVLQPIIVTRFDSSDSYRLVAGERRLRAAKLAGLSTIPAIVKEVSPQKALEIALIENIQREDLNPLETAEALERLNREFNLSHEEISKKVGKDRTTVTNYLRILKLPEKVKSLIDGDKITLGHAKALLTVPDDTKKVEVAKKILRYSLSVRATEALCKRLLDKKTLKEPLHSPEIEEIEVKLTHALGMEVKIYHKERKGKVEIRYETLDELERLLSKLIKE
ncbi:MAG: ParB/RepB/Spo0J family partition protein [Thermodesulfovibrionales bacterium]|nr:ParB/RepB/Spo0J family partition protein [Thermodesulfovibrionales bacterium]